MVCLLTIYLLPAFVVLISREIVGRLVTDYAGVDKLPDYLRSDTKDANQSHFPWQWSLYAEQVIIEK